MKSTKITKKDTKLKRQPRFESVNDFFLNTSPEEQQRVYREAIRRSNEDQRAVMRKAGYTFDFDPK